MGIEERKKWRGDGRAGEENSALRGTPPVLYPS